jgi:hypothetical protein
LPFLAKKVVESPPNIGQYNKTACPRPFVGPPRPNYFPPLVTAFKVLKTFGILPWAGMIGGLGVAERRTVLATVMLPPGGNQHEGFKTECDESSG